MKISYNPLNHAQRLARHQIAKLREHNPAARVVDIGGAAAGWSSDICDLVVDITAQDSDTTLSMDICRVADWQKLLAIVEQHGQFDYAICTHTLEDVYNPYTALDLLPSVAREGIISMPSVGAEMHHVENPGYLGYIHHRYLFDEQDGKMLIAPKMGFLERYTQPFECTQYKKEIAYEWQGSIEYTILMNNFLGPDVPTVFNTFQNFLNNTREKFV